MIIVESILDSARRNLNRSFHITKKEWRLLVVDDAISYIEPSVSNCNVEQTKFWINKAIKGYYHLEKNGSSRGFEAFEKIEISCDPDTDEIDFIENNDMKKGLEL